MNTLSIIICVLIVLVLTFFIYNLIKLKTARKVNQIKMEYIPKVKKEKKDTNTIDDKKTWLFNDIEKTRLKLIHSGLNDRFTVRTFIILKYSLALLCYLSKIDENKLYAIGFGIMGYLVLDVYARSKKKKKHREIMKEIEILIATTIEGLSIGLVPHSIIKLAINKVPEDNPLSSELKILNVKIMKSNLNKAIAEFKDRIDMEHIDNYCLSFLQYSMGGGAVEMLRKQLDVIKAIKDNQKRGETQYRSTYSNIAIALLVGSLLILILIPLSVRLKESI